MGQLKNAFDNDRDVISLKGYGQGHKVKVELSDREQDECEYGHLLH